MIVLYEFLIYATLESVAIGLRRATTCSLLWDLFSESVGYFSVDLIDSSFLNLRGHFSPFRSLLYEFPPLSLVCRQSLALSLPCLLLWRPRLPRPLRGRPCCCRPSNDVHGDHYGTVLQSGSHLRVESRSPI